MRLLQVLLGVFLLSSPVYASWSRVGTPTSAATGSGGATSLTVNYSPTAGNFIYVGGWCSCGGPVTSVVDSASETLSVARNLADAVASRTLYGFYIKAVASGVTSFTVNLPGTFKAQISVMEYHQTTAVAGDPLDFVAAINNVASSNTCTTIPISPSSGDLEISEMYNFGTTDTWSPTAPFSLVLNVSEADGEEIGFFDQINASTATATGTVTPSTFLSCYMATFKTTVVATCHVVTPSGSGTHSGADWNNAYNGIPDPLTRGDVYYLADGTYGSAQYIFQTAESGSTTISIKKAIASDHCTDTGWNTGTMGSSQAVLGGDGHAVQLEFLNGYITIDGNTTQTVAAKTGQGIKVDAHLCDHTQNAGFCFGIYVATANPVTLRAVEYRGQGDADVDTHPDDGLKCFTTCQNLTMQYNYMHDTSNDFLTFGPCTNPSNVSIDRNWFAINAGSVSNHGQAIQEDNCSNWTVSNSVFQDIEGTAFITMNTNSGTTDTVNIYGNIGFYSPGNSNSRTGLSASVECANQSGVGTCTNINVFNNTFSNLQATYGNTRSAVVISGTVAGATGFVKNNLWYNSAQAQHVTDANSTITASNNAYISTTFTMGETNAQSTPSTDPFVNDASNNFHLIANTNAGLALGSPYTPDPDGVMRTTWSRGAYEYVPTSHSTFLLLQ